MASTTPASCVMENTAVAPLSKSMNTLAASAQRVTLGCRFLAIPTNTQNGDGSRSTRAIAAAARSVA